jgi:hypothetical protein
MSSVVLDEVMASKSPGLSLGDFESIVDELAALERRKAEMLEAARRVISTVLTAPTVAQQLWQGLARVPSQEVHSEREQVERTFRSLVDAAAECEQLLPVATKIAGEPLPGSDRVSAVRAELTQFVDMILSRWTSLEDLEQLIVDTIELPEWVTKGPNPPGVGIPQHWIDDVDDDPFRPLPDAP